MAKKKNRQEPNPPKPKEFHSSPFSALKGVAVQPSPVEEKAKPVVVPKVTTANEELLFLEAMGGVVPIEGNRQKQGPAAVAGKTAGTTVTVRKVPVIEPVETDTFIKAIGQLKLDVTFKDSVPEDEDLKALGGNRLRQLKRGVVTLNRQLDRHGLTREEAVASLPGFLQSAVSCGEKAVLVITGKGNHSEGEPVLQQAVSGWLRDAGRKFVAEFAPAPREMGGSGALVIFLKD